MPASAVKHACGFSMAGAMFPPRQPGHGIGYCDVSVATTDRCWGMQSLQNACPHAAGGNCVADGVCSKQIPHVNDRRVVPRGMPTAGEEGGPEFGGLANALRLDGPAPEVDGAVFPRCPFVS